MGAGRPEEEQAAFQEFRKALAGKDKLDELDHAVAEAFAPLERNGLLASSKELEGFNQKTIEVCPADNPADRRDVEVSKVIVDPQAIRQKLAEGLKSQEIADRVYTWLEASPASVAPFTTPATLTKDPDASKRAQDENAAKVEPVMITYRPGDRLVKAGEKIDGSNLASLLKPEYQAFIEQRLFWDQFWRGCAVLLVVFAMFTLCGLYMRFRQRGVQAGLDRLTGALALAVVTVLAAVLAARDPWRAEPVGVILFGMTMAIAYRPELRSCSRASFPGSSCWRWAGIWPCSS